MKFLRHLRTLLLAALAVALAACAPTREASAPPPPHSVSLVAAREGGFSYRIPPGWFDASADSQARGHAALLIRNDYGATISVDEVHLDDAARSEITENGLLPVARLLLSLSSWDHDAILTMAPHSVDVEGRQACRYGLASGNGEDTVEVTLVESREKLFAVRVLVSGKKGGGKVSLRTIQEDFLGTVRW